MRATSHTTRTIALSSNGLTHCLQHSHTLSAASCHLIYLSVLIGGMLTQVAKDKQRLAWLGEKFLPISRPCMQTGAYAYMRQV